MMVLVTVFIPSCKSRIIVDVGWRYHDVTDYFSLHRLLLLCI